MSDDANFTNIAAEHLWVGGQRSPHRRLANFGGIGDFVVDSDGTAGGRLIVKENGNIGISNPNPTEKLDVGGTVRAAGVKVTGTLVVPKNPSANGAPPVVHVQLGQLYWDEDSIWIYTDQWRRISLS